MQAGYEDLFSARTKVDQTIPIFGHSYDFPIPDAAKVLCAGPWLKPGFDDRGWPDISVNRGIVKALLTEFAKLLDRLAADPKNNFIHVKTQGTIGSDALWANELHPTPDGFAQIAARFASQLGQRFPGRI